MALLAEKAVVVTGAGRGIGRAIALEAAREGARVIVADHGTALDGSGPDPAVAESVAREIVDKGGAALPVSASVATSEGARAIIDSALDAWGRVDGLVCCAGILRHRPFMELTEFDFDEVIATHLKGHFLMFQSAFKAMVANGQGGSLVAIGSGYVMGDPNRAPYRTAKAGIVGLTKSVALAGREHAIRANVLSPVADTRMTEASGLKIGSVPEDIAPLAAYLLSDQSAEVTGEVFSISGQSIAIWEDPAESRKVQHHSRWTAGAITGAMPWLRAGRPASAPQVPPLPVSVIPGEVSRD
ncbi:SDR family NAD(P)-dependent oxidoreductase [Novosphingobium album (ex Hu et al. 2023)]|uniref:SDR family oxidoreductase n=1 Tax=Novosphingobium album (ex Hu et al. 2023) TaxID=2930093 RepID=A0ABT0B034_9SPHN|nr:SDR family NAD(P)-dependent oxidoreductase [Novosphingobium album (ex Hu et al. 2023)]MCJ2178390.1 SDR family oxidoreductase [Novosphingobium album (ex Hu et al. 2023)]